MSVRNLSISPSRPLTAVFFWPTVTSVVALAVRPSAIVLSCAVLSAVSVCNCLKVALSASNLSRLRNCVSMSPLVVASVLPSVAMLALLVPMVVAEVTAFVVAVWITWPLPVALPVSLTSCSWYCLICVSAIWRGLGLFHWPGLISG